MKVPYKPIFFALVYSSFLLFYFKVQAEEAPARSPWKVEDVVFQERAGGFEISPDGAWVVWTKTTADKDKDRYITHLFLSSLGETGKTLQLTRGEDSEFRPKWSPSGKIIGFMTSRKTKEPKDETFGGQVWFMDQRGGEPWAVTGVQTGVTDYDWIDEDHLLLVARENLTLLEQQAKEKRTPLMSPKIRSICRLRGCFSLTSQRKR
jgi:dipeptidyl aminopeptidase/acylaminoacyl peptidase